MRFGASTKERKRVMTMESCVDFVSPPLFKKETQQQKKRKEKVVQRKERERKKKQTDILKP